MTISRRNFLKMAGASGAASVSLMKFEHAFASMSPEQFQPATQANRSDVHHVINRLTFGPTDELINRAEQMGVEAFIEEQLNYEALEDNSLDAYGDYFDDLALNAGELLAKYQDAVQTVYPILAGSWMIRGLYSPRQLYERMVHFWTDHFSIFASNGIETALKFDDDRDVIRRHALGNFRDLLGASAHSPAMLVYLDNAVSEKSAPNENYARELLELHTMGIGGGYTELDVKEVARAFTGWSVTRPNRTRNTDRVEFIFRDFNHDEGEKIVLGQTIPAKGGQADGELVLDILASHPSTARFISEKLCRRFVADNPPSEIVEAAAQTFLDTNGDIKSVMRTIFNSQVFRTASPKFKRPIEYSLSVLRSMNYEVSDVRQFMRALGFVLQNLGHVPFRRSTPDGYPDTQADWIDNLLMRWNVAIASVHGDVPGAEASIVPILEQNNIPLEPEPILQFMASTLYGRSLNNDEIEILTAYLLDASAEPVKDLQDALALLLSAPAFQYR